MLEPIIQAANQLNTKVFKRFIRASVSIQEAQTEQSNILDYVPKAKAQEDYIKFVEEFLEGTNDE